MNKWEERFEEKFTYANAPMRVVDENGYAITPEPMSRAIKAFISQELKKAREERDLPFFDVVKKSEIHVRLSNRDMRNMLNDLLKNGHGGGNWRRLIMTKLEELKEQS